MFILTTMSKKAKNWVHYLIKPNLLGNNAWLGLRDDLLLPGADGEGQARELGRRFGAVQAWFSDLDDFDTRSPAKIIALRAVGTGHFRLGYLRWAMRSLGLIFSRGLSQAENLSWKLYYDTFLKTALDGDWLNEAGFRFIDRLLTPAGVARLLYPGVADFYSSFGADKFLVTRSLERIAWRYSRVLPYSGYYSEVGDKAQLMEAFIKARPGIRYYGLGGDSSVDAEAAEVLEHCHRKGRIEKPLCLFRAHSPLALDLRFNVFVGKDRSALAGLLAQAASRS